MSSMDDLYFRIMVNGSPLKNSDGKEYLFKELDKAISTVDSCYGLRSLLYDKISIEPTMIAGKEVELFVDGERVGESRSHYIKL